MKLSEYARKERIGYRAAWNRYKLGRIEGAYLDHSGNIVVPDPEHHKIESAVVYARVSTHKQRSDLQRPAYTAFAQRAAAPMRLYPH